MTKEEPGLLLTPHPLLLSHSHEETLPLATGAACYRIGARGIPRQAHTPGCRQCGGFRPRYHFARVGGAAVQRVGPARGVLPIAMAAAKWGYTRIIVPHANASEAALVPGLEVVSGVALVNNEDSDAYGYNWKKKINLEKEDC